MLHCNSTQVDRAFQNQRQTSHETTLTRIQSCPREWTDAGED